MIPVLAPLLDGNELKYVSECVTSGWISSKGEFVTLFEKKLGELIGNPYVVAVSNGTVALSLALSAFGIGPGDEVIVPDFTFAATINSVIHVGATPVIADVELSSWNLSTSNLEKLITKKTKAVMPVHLYGQPVEMHKMKVFCEQHSLLLIEDCAEALGTVYSGIHVGNFGDAGTFSFFGNKLITTGEGGAIVFKSKEVYEKAKILRDHGMNPQKRYWHDVVGFNYRLTNLQAAIGLAQLERYSDIVTKKKNIYDFYDSHLMGLRSIQKRTMEDNFVQGYWLYTVKLSDSFLSERDRIIRSLFELGIETRPGFYPIHQMPPYKDFKRDDCLNSLMISSTTISLPTGAALTEKELKQVVTEFIKILDT